MDTSSAREIFDLSYNALVKEFGEGPMSDTEIASVGHKWFGKKWAGVGSADRRFKPLPDRYFIVNTGHEHSKGIHWVGAYRSPRGQVYAFDSFGRALPTILSGFARRSTKEGYGPAVEVNRDEIQSDSTNVCGQISLAWLNTIRLAGLTATNRLLAYSPQLLRELRGKVAIGGSKSSGAS